MNSQEHAALSKKAAREGMVLLKNLSVPEGGCLLPFMPGQKLSLFGKGTFDYVKGGGGSGDVTARYVRDLYDGLKEIGTVDVFEPLAAFYRDYVRAEYAAGCIPGLISEPAVPADLLEEAAAFSDTAVISISRYSSEGWDRWGKEGLPDYAKDYIRQEARRGYLQKARELFPDGDYSLTQAERDLVAAVTEHFAKVVVVLNVGGVIDTTWFHKNDSIGAVLLAWQAGMEGGTAAAELLCGVKSPSGKLPDTFADALESYPSTAGFHEAYDHVDYTEDIFVGYRYFETIPGKAPQVNYPFGFGLSYTTFDVKTVDAQEGDGCIRFTCQVTNTGTVSGRETVQLYVQKPQGRLGNPYRVLADYHKTAMLAPGETETFELGVSGEALVSFDDTGKIEASAWVLEEGVYSFAIGTDVRSAGRLNYTWKAETSRVLSRKEAVLMPHALQKRLTAQGDHETLPVDGAEPAWKENVLQALTKAEYEGTVPVMHDFPPAQPDFPKVLSGEVTPEAFVKSLSDEELAEILGGRPNTGLANTYGIGGLPGRRLPAFMTADGPAGVRILPEKGVKTTAFPCAALLASTWDEELVYEVGKAGAEELKELGFDIWLTPAVNIHRSPLCGRNFEYYSEDPLLAGRQAAALVKGIESMGAAACVKHFACNNKETARKVSDSRVSARALREIYLKPFEIVVKTAHPSAVMTAYNLINGERASESAGLLQGILREDFGFTGLVMTDWWNAAEHYKEVMAGNDVKMACGYPERLLAALKGSALTRKAMEACGVRVVRMAAALEVAGTDGRIA